MQELRSMAVVPELAPGLGLGARSRRPGPYRGRGPSGRHLLAALRLSSSWASRAQGRLVPRQRHRTPPGPPGSASKGWPVSYLCLSRASLPGEREALDAVPLPEETRGRLAPRSTTPGGHPFRPASWRRSPNRDCRRDPTRRLSRWPGCRCAVCLSPCCGANQSAAAFLVKALARGHWTPTAVENAVEKPLATAADSDNLEMPIAHCRRLRGDR